MVFRPLRESLIPANIDQAATFQRALVAYFQTGNVGILDSLAQLKFRNSPPSVPAENPIFGVKPLDMLHGVVAVTEALWFDNNLWPRRGVVSGRDPLDPNKRKTAPSPDESLLFPTDLEYAQNGRFAVVSPYHREGQSQASRGTSFRPYV